MVGMFLQVGDQVLQFHADTGKTCHALAQHVLQLGLVKVMVVGAAVWSKRGGATPDQQGFIGRVDKVHALHAGT